VKLQFRHRDPNGARYTAAAARSLIGQTPRFNVRQSDDGPILADLGTAVVTSAEVVDDGAAVLITIEAPDLPEELNHG
jgi:hypothetical protein